MLGVLIPVVLTENLLDLPPPGPQTRGCRAVSLDPGDSLKEVGILAVAVSTETALPIDVVDFSRHVLDFKKDVGHCSVVWNSLMVADQGALPPPNSKDHIKTAARRSRLRIMSVSRCHFVRLRVLWCSSAQRTPSFSISTMMAWMVPLWRLGSRPMDLTSAEQVWGPLFSSALRTLVRMMDASIVLWCGTNVV